MVKTFFNGALIIGGGEVYDSYKVIELPGEDGLFKEFSTDSEHRETKFTLMENHIHKALVRGFYMNNETFHIQNVENLENDRNGFNYLSKIFPLVIQDLKVEGVKKITSNVLAKYAHIPVKRYGFRASNGKSAKQLKRSWRRHIPIMVCSLEKTLS